MAPVAVGRPALQADRDTMVPSEGECAGESPPHEIADPPASGVATQLSFVLTEIGKDGSGALLQALPGDTAQHAAAAGIPAEYLASPPGSAILPVTEVAPPAKSRRRPAAHEDSERPPPPSGASATAEAGPHETGEGGVHHREVWSLAQLRALVNRGAKPTEIKSFNSLSGALPRPVVVRGPGGQCKVVRGESIVAAAIALERPRLVLDVYHARTDAKFVVEVLRDLGPLGQPTRDPVLRVTLIARLRALEWASIDIAGAAGWTPARVCQVLRVADLQTCCPAAWSLFRRRCLADEVARKIAVNLARDPSRTTEVSEMLDQVKVDLSDLAGTRRLFRGVVAIAFPATSPRGRSAASVERPLPKDLVGGASRKPTIPHHREHGRVQTPTRSLAHG